MALIDTTTFLGITDRLAAQYGILKVAFTAAAATGTGLFVSRVITADDVDIEIPTLAPFSDADHGMNLAQAVASGTLSSYVTNGLISHLNRVNQTDGIDGYCSDNDIRVSDYFNQVYKITYNNFLRANSVFSEGDDVFGTVNLTSGPTVVFTDGINYGNGSAMNFANGSYFAATQLKVKVTDCGTGSTLAANLYLTLTVKTVTNQLSTINVQLPSGTALNAEIDVGTSSNRYLDVTNVAFTGVSNRGTVGDEVTIYNKKDRVVIL